MARSIIFKIGGKSHKLMGSFDAGERISLEVADLMMIQREAILAAMMAEKGIPYNPRWNMSLTDVLAIISIALEDNGVEFDADNLKTQIFEMGFDAAHNIAIKYLQLFFAEPEKVPQGDKVKAEDAGK